MAARKPDSGANVNITSRCPAAMASGLTSVSTDMSPPIQRHWRTRLVGDRGSDSTASVVSTVDAEALPSQRCNEVSIRPTVSVAGEKQRRAAALANTTGRCLWRASTTTTASRRLSRAVSAKARVVLVASLR